MSVNLVATPAANLYPVPGVRWGITEAGIRKSDRKDLAVLLLDEGSTVGGVFTQNRFCAAPVQICREHLAMSQSQNPGIRAMLVNTGNANAGTGSEGRSRAMACCTALARELGLEACQILPFSTGVIMEPLPHERIVAGLPAALADAREDNWANAAEAIMTTDTMIKAFSSRITLAGRTVTITGIAKGAGMIRPNMATMLGFMATDACLSPALLAPLAAELAENSFNRITVDGDTSTNDSFVLATTHRARNPPVTSLESPDGRVLRAALLDIAKKLAQAIVRDGEGATKFITIEVEGGKTGEECRLVAYAIAHSPLVKTAFFASDPNLGRILAAVGYAGISDLDQTKIDLYLDDVLVARNGGRYADYIEADGQRVMQQSEITVRVALGRGQAHETVWTCDLSHEYVRINADYRS